MKQMKRSYERGIVFCLLTIFLILAYSSMINNSATFDEPNFITAGYSYWTAEDFRLNAEHPPVAKLLAGFPLQFMTPEPVLNTTSPHWIHAADPMYMFEHQWDLSGDFLYSGVNDAEKIIFFARLPFLLIGILLGLYVYRWAKELYGQYAGLFALFLYSLCPNMLAYTQLVITDFVFTAFFFITMYYFWRWRSERKIRDVILSGIFFGMALASKFSAVYMIPIIGILIGAEWIFHYKSKTFNFQKQIQHDCVGVALASVVALVVIAAMYFFIHARDYFLVIAFTIWRSVSGHLAYLLGSYSSQGWWYYFIVVFFSKTQSSLIILLFVLLFLLCVFKKWRRENFCVDLILIIPPVFYFIAFMFNYINIGIRHILPIYPFLFVFVSKAVMLEFEREQTKKIWKVILFLLLVWYAASTFFIAPHFLSFFNDFVSGPENGPNILLDSNIDWGQDMNRLEQWIEKNDLRNTAVYYSVFTTEPLGYRDIQIAAVPCTPHPGIFVLSVNNLYDLAQNREGCFDWLRAREPTEKIGYSIFIYNITDSDLEEQKRQCTEECTAACEAYNKTFQEYIFTDHCVCGCE